MSAATATRNKRVRCTDCGRRVRRREAIADEQGDAHCTACIECPGWQNVPSDAPDGAAQALAEELVF